MFVFVPVYLSIASLPVHLFRSIYKTKRFFFKHFQNYGNLFRSIFAVCQIFFVRRAKNVANKMPFYRSNFQWMNQSVSQSSNQQASKTLSQQLERIVQMVKIVEIIWWHAILCLTKTLHKCERMRHMNHVINKITRRERASEQARKRMRKQRVEGLGCVLLYLIVIWMPQSNDKAYRRLVCWPSTINAM